MSARDTATIDAIRQCADTLTRCFVEAGCVHIDPDILQPADLFLDRYGEEIRSRTYVFTDPDGDELCLRPDLTVPTCRYHLDIDPDGASPTRYCYAGPVFRFQPGGEQGGRPREFAQAGMEWFGDGNAQRTNVDVLVLAHRTLRTAGLDGFATHIGDLGLFAALLDGLAMPGRWRERLKQRFWRPTAFRTLLARLAGQEMPRDNADHRAMIETVSALTLNQAMDVVESRLAASDVPLVGGRTIEDIATRLLDQAADAHAHPLPDETVGLITEYLVIEGGARAVLPQIRQLIGHVGGPVEDAISAYSRRLDLLEEASIDVDECQFSAEFGRNLEYYTGFVFQLEMPGMGPVGQLAGGGRYDGMLQGLGAPRTIPAIGLAIHMDRLVAILKAKAS